MGKNEVPKHQSVFTSVRSIFSFSLLLSCAFSDTTHFDNQRSAADSLRGLICTHKNGEKEREKEAGLHQKKTEKESAFES
jgi:hypothetical protein